MSVRRPASATIAGGIVLGFGALLAGSATGGILANAIVGPVPAGHQIGPAAWLSARYTEMAVAQMALGLINVALGYGVFRRVRWARSGTQHAMAAQAILMILFGPWMATWLPLGHGKAAFAALLVVWRAAAVGTGVSFAVPLAVAAWLLERPSARQWYQEPSAALSTQTAGLPRPSLSEAPPDA